MKTAWIPLADRLHKEEPDDFRRRLNKLFRAALEQHCARLADRITKDLEAFQAKRRDERFE